MDFWRKTISAGLDALGLDPNEYGVRPQPRYGQPGYGQPPGGQPGRPSLNGDSMYIPPSQCMQAQHQQGVQHPHAGYGGPAQYGPDDEKGREIERLRKEIRKVEEKTSFFRNQVNTLQQQLNTMDPMSSATAVALPGHSASEDEISRLRQGLQQEQARTRQFRAQLTSPSTAHSGGDVERLRARIGELEQELADIRHGGPSSGINSVATPTRSSFSRRSISGAGSEFSQSLLGSSPQHGRSDLLDPSANPGGSKRAVVIGCNYPGQTGVLRAGATDAQQWARFFTKRCSMPEKDIRLLTDSKEQQSVRELIPTRDNIMRALQWLCSRSASGDQLFFVFCGHGVQVVAEEFAGQKLCENSIAPTDVLSDGGSHPRVVSDTDVHKALSLVPSGAQVTLIYDSCHAGSPLDRSGLNYLTEHVKRGNVDYEKLKGHPVLPRFLELGHWKVRPTPPEAVRESNLRCQAVQWAACANDQFCVELPIEDQTRGVFTYILICALLKVGVSASSESLLSEVRSMTSSLKGRWRLQQDVRLVVANSASGSQKFLK